MNLDGPIDPPEPPDVYAHACWHCYQGRCEDCTRIGNCACCDTNEEELDECEWCADCGIDPCACEPMAVGIVDKGLVAR